MNLFVVKRPVERSIGNQFWGGSRWVPREEAALYSKGEAEAIIKVHKFYFPVDEFKAESVPGRG